MISSSLLCPLSSLCDGVGSTLGKGVADGVFGALSGWVASGATWLVHHVVSLIGPTTQVQLTAAWFGPRERAMDVVTFAVVGPLVAIATIGAIVRQDASRLLRIYAVGLPVGLIVGTAAVAIVGLFLKAVDDLCGLITPASLPATFGQAVGRLATPGVPGVIQLLIAGVVILGTLSLWLELVLRATAIDLAVFFFPLALATMIWPATAPVAKRFVEVLVALVGSKFVIVATLTLGVAAIGAQHHPIDATITGAAVLLLAAFAPFAVLRLVPLVEVAAIGHLEGMSRRPGRAAVGAAATANRMASGPAGGLLERLGSGDGSGVEAATVASAGVTEHVGDWTPETGFGGDGAPGGRTGSATRTGSGSGTAAAPGSGSESAGAGSSDSDGTAASSGGTDEPATGGAEPWPASSATGAATASAAAPAVGEAPGWWLPPDVAGPNEEPDDE